MSLDNWDDVLQDEAGEDQEIQDYGYGGKDALLFLVDASPAMHVKSERLAEDSVANPFQMSLKAIGQAMMGKIFTSPNDLFGVVFFGTRNSVGVDGFGHLSVLSNLDVPSAEMILKIEELYTDPDRGWDNFERTYGGSSSEFRLNEALWHCQAMFGNVRGKIATKTILLFTCVDHPHFDDSQKTRQSIQKAKDVRESGINLEVIHLCDDFDLGKFYKPLLDIKEEEDMTVFSGADRLEELGRVIRRRIHKKRSIGKLRFNLGNDIQFTVSTYNFVRKAYKPGKKMLARDSNEDVKLQRNFINPATGAALLPSDINKFQEYGGKRIKFTQDETKSMAMLDRELGLKLCGFKPLSCLRWGEFVRSGYFIYPEESIIKGSRQLFAALLIKCHEKKVMAICSFKARDNSGPSFVALVPQIEVKDEDGKQLKAPGFQLVFLPFADDVRSVPEVKFIEAKEDHVKAAKSVIENLGKIAYDPLGIENPDLQNHFKLIESIGLDRDDIPPVEDMTLPPVDIQEKWLNGAGEKFMEVVYPNGFNPGLGTKRKSSQASQGRSSLQSQSQIDMDEYVRTSSVQKLTVAQLREWLISKGQSVSHKKKGDLVNDVYAKYNG